MSDLTPMSELIADDLFLDRLAGRVDAGSEPLAGLLGALAAQADTPLPSQTGRRRIANKHRYFGAFAALAVAASGAGVAAAVTLPSNGPSQADRARIVKMMDESARSSVPSGLLARLGIPQTVGTTQAAGLVLARRADGSIVLLPAAVVTAGRPTAEARQAAASGADHSAATGNARGADTATRNGQGSNGQGGTEGAAGTTTGQGDRQGGSTQTGTPVSTSGRKSTAGTKGGKNATPTAPTTGAVVPQTTLAPATTPATTPSSQARTAAPSPTKRSQTKPTATSGTATSGTLGAVGGAAGS